MDEYPDNWPVSACAAVDEAVDRAEKAEARVAALEAKLEVRRVLYEECWVCKGAFAIVDSHPIPRCDDHEPSSEQIEAWDEMLYAVPCERTAGCTKLPYWHEGECTVPASSK